jgi:hypothetical protein
MSPTKKTLIVVFGGMAVMVVTTVGGAMIALILTRYSLYVDVPGQYGGIFHAVYGGAIGAVVGVPIWVWLGYMVCRDKKPAELPPGPPSS